MTDGYDLWTGLSYFQNPAFSSSDPPKYLHTTSSNLMEMAAVASHLHPGRSGYNARCYGGYDCDDRRIISPPPAILANHCQTSQFTIAAQTPWHYILLGMWAIGARIFDDSGSTARHPATTAAPRGCG